MGNEKQYTCIPDKSLCKLRALWNARHPDDKITEKNFKKVWIALKNRFKNVCDRESCWLRQNFTDGKMRKELNDAFAPKSPTAWKKNPNEWLSSNEITAVMKQYEKKHDDFVFLGPSPIDYDTHKMYGECVWEELCHFDLKKEIREKGKKKFGVIFNLDPHYKGGSHWVSLFIDVDKKIVFHFDSVGKAAHKQIKKFADDVIRQGLHLPEPVYFKYDENHPTEHQYGDTECGIYSLYFVITLLEGKKDINYFKRKRIPDKEMEKFRKVYFNEEV